MFNKLAKIVRQGHIKWQEEKRKREVREKAEEQAILSAKQRGYDEHDEMVRKVLRELANALGFGTFRRGEVKIFGKRPKRAEDFCGWWLECDERNEVSIWVGDDRFFVTDHSIRIVGDQVEQENVWSTDGRSQKSLVETLTTIFSR